MEEVALFWRLVEQMLAALFFFLIGLEVLTVDWSWFLVGMAAMGWIVVLVARFITVLVGYGSLAVMIDVGKVRNFIFPMTLAGVRGAISIALALSLPLAGEFPYRDHIIVMTFGAVVIGLLIQGGALILMAEPLQKAEESTLRLRRPFRNLLSSQFWRHHMKKHFLRRRNKNQS
jgi:CPA1 family monovalent cation:H+ antiporter